MMRVKKLLRIVGLLVVLLGLARYGPMLASWAVIPPEHGYFRENPWRSDFYSSPHMDFYWNYRCVDDGILKTINWRQGGNWETWELLRDSGHRHFLYDKWNECDGVAEFSRTELRIRNRVGMEEVYPRVLDLWEIWLERSRLVEPMKYSHNLRLMRAEHERLVEQRRIEQGLALSPGEEARRRPPVLPLESAAPAIPAHLRPLFAITEFGYRNETGTVFALYADGTAICRTLPENEAAPYHLLKLADPKAFVDRVRAEKWLSGKRWELSEGSDQLETTVWVDGQKIEVYGDWRAPHLMSEDEGNAEPNKAWNESIRADWEKRTKDIRPFMVEIDEMREREGVPWLPPKIEVVFWEYEHAADRPLHWPQEWPGIYDRSSRKRGAAVYSVYVPAGDLKKLRGFLDQRPERAAIMIDLVQMIPHVRFPFPGEEQWLRR